MSTIGSVVLDIPLEDIIVKKNRYRKDFGDIEALARSIDITGLFTPIVINDKNELIAGERRFKAHQFLKRETIRAVISDANEVESKIIEISENMDRKNFTWQENAIAYKDLHDMLSEFHPDWSGRGTARVLHMSIGTAFNALKIGKALQEHPEIFKGVTTQEAAFKAVKQYEVDQVKKEMLRRKREAGSLKNASQYILHGNCLDLIKNLPDNYIDAIISDPPYGVNITDTKKVNKTHHVGEIYKDDEKGYKELMSALIKEFPRVCKDDSWVILFVAIENFYWMKEELESVGYDKLDYNPAIWHRTNSSGQTNKPLLFYGRSFETFIYGCRGNINLARPGQSNLLPFAGIVGDDKNHPVEKPVELLEEIISRHCHPGYNILDPFSGSGSTIIAGLKQNCNPIGFELDQTYYDRSLLRISEFLDE